MKTLILLVLAVVGAHAAIEQTAARAGLNVGAIGVGDRLLHRSYVTRGAIANTAQSQDVVFRGNSTTRVTAVHAFEVGVSQMATARIVSGGVGRNTVTIRFQSARGRGYYYELNIWGR